MINQQKFFSAQLSSAHENSRGTQPLNETLTEFASFIERQSSGSLLTSILLLDETGRHLFRGAAPSLPKEYCEQIDGIEIGPSAGSCGTAVYCEHPIYVCDIERDTLWAPFKHLALNHGLRACWSVPITTTANKILGTFALYYREIKNPTLEERKFIEDCACEVGFFIEQYRLNAA